MKMNILKKTLDQITYHFPFTIKCTPAYDLCVVDVKT